MKTFKRIDKICSAVELAKNEFYDRQIVVADIATDHGYIAEKLSKKSFVKEVVATDISAKSLNKLEKLIEFRKLSHINCVLGDGLAPIDHADVSVIAGIGGYEIIKMLNCQNVNSDFERKCDVFVLQPAQNVNELREYIIKNQIFMLKDFIIYDEDRFYPIIVINLSKKQRNKLSIFNVWLGRDNQVSEPDFVAFLYETMEYLSFLNDIPKKRIFKDKVLKQKYKLKKLVNKLLNRRELC